MTRFKIFGEVIVVLLTQFNDFAKNVLIDILKFSHHWIIKTPFDFYLKYLF